MRRPVRTGLTLVGISIGIARLPPVSATCPYFVELMSIEDSEMMILSAREWSCVLWENLKLVSGRMPQDANEPAVVWARRLRKCCKKSR